MTIFEAVKHFSANPDRDGFPPEFESLAGDDPPEQNSVLNLVVRESPYTFEIQVSMRACHLAAIAESSGLLPSCRDDSDLDTAVAVALDMELRVNRAAAMDRINKRAKELFQEAIWAEIKRERKRHQDGG